MEPPWQISRGGRRKCRSIPWNIKQQQPQEGEERERIYPCLFALLRISFIISSNGYDRRQQQGQEHIHVA